MSEAWDIPFRRVLDPMERISETLFGLIMALTFTCSVGFVTAGNINIRAMLIGTLGGNLAWGVIDALLARVSDRGRKILTLRAMRHVPDFETAQRIIADALPLASVLPSEQLELMRKKLHQLPEPSERPSLTKRDWIGARVSAG